MDPKKTQETGEIKRERLSPQMEGRSQVEEDSGDPDNSAGVDSRPSGSRVSLESVTQQQNGGNPIKAEESTNEGVSSSEDNMSDLDEDLETLARRPAPGTADNTAKDGSTTAERDAVHVPSPQNSLNPTSNDVSLLSDEEENQPGSSRVLALRNGGVTGNSLSESSPYTLRNRKRHIDFSIYQEDSEDDEEDSAKKPKKSPTKKETVPLEVLSLKHEELQRFIDTPRYTKTKNSWRFNPSVLHNNKVNPKLSEFIAKCGSFLDHLHLMWTSFSGDSYAQKSILGPLIRHSTNLRKISLIYMSTSDVMEFITKLKSWKGKLKQLSVLRVTSITGDGILKKCVIDGLVETGIKWTELELGDFLWEDAGPEALERLLEASKDSLTSLIIHGGFRGTKKEKFVVKFPRMKELHTVSICSKYSFLSVMMNPMSKKAREIRLDLTEEKEEPFKFALQFTSDLPQLKSLTLGNLVEIEELPFSYVKKLKTFKCGSYWNLSIRFPVDGSRSALQGSTVTALQLPDALKDPSFIPKLAKFFPNVTKVWINLPSVPVLRSFFKNFGSSRVEELTLKTQFDFESLMESCLLPEDSDALRRSHLTQTQVDTLKEYKWFSEYIRYYNVELPLEAGDLMEGNSAGIRALKCLKRLHLEHIPRVLSIPNPDDERKWFDHNCKFLSQTFGYTLYPFSRKCHLEILRMNLDQYTWKNLSHTDRNSIEAFNYVGYTAMKEAEVHQMSDDDDLFVPIGRSRGVNVAIQPSMLLPDYFKSKPE